MRASIVELEANERGMIKTYKLFLARVPVTSDRIQIENRIYEINCVFMLSEGEIEARVTANLSYEK